MAAAFGMGEWAALGFVREQDRRRAVVGVGVDAVVDFSYVDAFGQDFEVAGVEGVGDEKVADGRARQCLDAIDSSFGRGAFQGGAAEDGRGHPGSTGAAPQGVGKEGDAVAVEADAAYFPRHAVHEDVGALGWPEHGDEHAVEVRLAQVAILAGDGLAVGGGGANGGEGGAAFGESAGSGSKLEGEGLIRPDAGALGEAFQLVDPVGGDGLDAGALPAGPFQGGLCGEAAVGGALHGFGELEADEVAEALAVLEAEVSR